ncbi:MAG: hypothetical protein WD845_11470 [Pirellulales bacterium]
MTAEINDDDRQRIIDALYAGRRIEAIKIYRQATSNDLKSAKTFIDELGARLRVESPEHFAAPSGRGCGTALALLAAMIILVGGGVALLMAIFSPGQQGAPPVAAAAPAANAGRMQPMGPQNASDPAAPLDAAQEQAPPFADDLAGRWRLNLPAGFEHPAELERVDAQHYRLRTKGVMNGVYRLRGNRLVMETPVDQRQVGMWEFRWQIENDRQLRLIGQPDPQRYNGANYLGATLTKSGH